MQQGRFVSIRRCSRQRQQISVVHFWRATLGQFWRALKRHATNRERRHPAWSSTRDSFVITLRMRPLPISRPGSESWPSRRFSVPLCKRLCLSTPGVLGSRTSSVVSRAPRVLRPHPSVPQARDDFTAWPLIRRAFAVRVRLGDPRDFPYFRDRTLQACRRPYAGGFEMLSRCSCAPRCQAASLCPRVATHENPPLPAIFGGEYFSNAASFALCCGPSGCPALLTGSDPMTSRARHRAFRGPCHSRFGRCPLPGHAGNQARWVNGKSPIVGTRTRPVTAASEAARRVEQWRGSGFE